MDPRGAGSTGLCIKELSDWPAMCGLFPPAAAALTLTLHLQPPCRINLFCHPKPPGPDLLSTAGL